MGLDRARDVRPTVDGDTYPVGDLEAAKARVIGPIPERLPVMDWSAYTTHRDPVLTLYASFDLPNAIDPDDHIHGHKTIDPASGAVLNENQLKIGSEFFYPMHFSLHLTWKNLGYWIVGFAALVMLAALVSGVVIHRMLERLTAGGSDAMRLYVQVFILAWIGRTLAAGLAARIIEPDAGIWYEARQ